MATTDNFCGHCGQENEDQTIGIKFLAHDVLSSIASFDSKLLRTWVPFTVRPGFLTNEYNAGRRVHYLSPLKLYLTFSVLFFLLLPFTRHASLVDTSTLASTTAKTKLARQTAAAQVNSAVNSDEDLKDAQSDLKAEVKAEVKDDAPSLKLAPSHGGATLSVGRSTYDLTHLPATVAAYNAQQNDPHHAPDPQSIQYLKRQIIKVKQNPKSLSDALLDYIPKMMFVLLPAFALSLKLLYLRSKRFYIEHLIFGLHLHAFLFLLLTIFLLVDFAAPHAAAAAPVAVCVFLLYAYRAMSVVYKQSWSKTLVKCSLLAFTYLFLLLFAFLGVLAAAFLFL